jgi:2-dehydro-3-deoxy-D-gluconate 5-dehydrogenase
MILEQFNLRGKSGIVTGGGTGLGKAMATALVQAGAEVLIVGRRKEVLEKTAKELGNFSGKVAFFSADLSQMTEIPKVVNETLKEFGKIDFLFNNAGTIRRVPCEDYSEADWDTVLEINLKGPFFLAQAVARTMIATRRPGSIVNTSSLTAFSGGKWIPAYAASKGGINQVTKTMANDWAKYGIRVNAIALGYFITDLTEPLRQNKERYAELLSRIPLGRWGNPEEIGGMAIYLASDASSYVTGQTLIIDGGWMGT